MHYLHFRRALLASEAPPWARGASSGQLQAAAAAAQQTGVEHVNTSSEVSESSKGSNGRPEPASSASNGTDMPELCSPDDLVLEPGECSHIDRSSPLDPADVYRCSGCLEEACQVISAHSPWFVVCMPEPSGIPELSARDAPGVQVLGLWLLAGTIRVCKDAVEESARGLPEGDPDGQSL